MRPVAKLIAQHLSWIVVLLALPALVFSAVILFFVWGGLLVGLGLFQAAAIIMLALALPFLAIFGPVQARAQRGWCAWAWLASPFIPFAILLGLLVW